MNETLNDDTMNEMDGFRYVSREHEYRAIESTLQSENISSATSP